MWYLGAPATLVGLNAERWGSDTPMSYVGDEGMLEGCLMLALGGTQEAAARTVPGNPIADQFGVGLLTICILTG